MFRQTRWKIVATIMAVMIALLAGTLGVIYLSSSIDLYKSYQEMLGSHIRQFSIEDLVRESNPGFRDDRLPGKSADAAYQLSTFYTVIFSQTGTVKLIENSSIVYNDDELISIAFDAAEEMGGGKTGSLVYRCGQKGGFTIVAFMDNTILSESATTLFRYTTIFGLAAIAVIFLLSIKAAAWIVQPLEESYDKQKQFISDAGHEFKTPIAIIRANAEILSRENSESQWIDNIQHETERMNELIVQLLELTRTEQTEPKFEAVDMSRLVTGEALPFESIAFEKSVRLICSIQEGIRLCGDSIQMKQLVSILMDNAFRHSPSGGEITLRLTQKRGCAVLSVTNEGDPIPAEQQKLLFDRFYRADESRSGREHRYGLGLAIAKAIVTAHRGRIGVQCQNRHIEFSVTLPVL